MTTIGPRLSNDDGDSNEKDKKKTDRFRLAKQQHDCDMNLPNSTRPLCGVGEHNTKSLLFLFLNSDGAFRISPTFDKLYEIE